MNRNQPVRTLQSLSARREALERYAVAHDRFSEAEQMYVACGQVALAEGAHAYALRTLQAWLAERDDPPPEGLE